VIGCFLDLENGIFFRRWRMGSSFYAFHLEPLQCVIDFEEKYYAHREKRNLLILEITVNSSGCLLPTNIFLEKKVNFGSSLDVSLELVESNESLWFMKVELQKLRELIVTKLWLLLHQV
jgi:hypothetical protein